MSLPRAPLLATAALVLASACRCGAPDAPAVAPPERAYVPDARCPLDRAAVAGAGAPLGRFESALEAHVAAFDAGRFDEALACAQEAARLEPDSAEAHLDRALALDALDQVREAHHAYERAIALAPDEPEVLRAMSDFLLREGTTDALEAAVLLARRGRESADGVPAAAELAAIEAASLNALGRPSEALRAAETALALDADLHDAVLERGIALFELLDFPEAERALADARRRSPQDAKAAHFLGLVLERLGREDDASAMFAEAAKLDAEGYPAALDVPAREFQALFDDELARLPEADRARLVSCAVGWEEMPAVADLEAGEPVLSPTIVGLYRPGEGGARDAIVLFRRNLLRLARTEEELRREVRDTLLHELGHHLGESDAELRDRGL